MFKRHTLEMCAEQVQGTENKVNSLLLTISKSFTTGINGLDCTTHEDLKHIRDILTVILTVILTEGNLNKVVAEYYFL
jgi:hypothetical protein